MHRLSVNKDEYIQSAACGRRKLQRQVGPRDTANLSLSAWLCTVLTLHSAAQRRMPDCQYVQSGAEKVDHHAVGEHNLHKLLLNSMVTFLYRI